MIAVTVSCLILVVFQAGLCRGFHWRYGDHEENWHPLCKSGKRQSPIALSTSIAEQKTFPPFMFKGYDLNNPAKLKNNGHSAEIRFHIAEQPTISGGELPGTYKLDHLHFHWKSEHTIEDYRFPLELHLVHYDQNFNSLSEALSQEKGVAVFSVLFYLSPEDDNEFTPLVAVMEELRDDVGVERQMSVNLNDFVPRDTAGFYRYDGSLTTPNCTEGIIWTVFTNTLPISSKQSHYFSQMKTEEHKDLPKNYRALQDLHSRTVYLQSSPMGFRLSSSAMKSGAFYSIFLVFIVFAVKLY